MDAAKFIVNAEAAVYRDGAYLLAERAEHEDHAGGMLSLVGGKVEASAPGSAALEATVRREVREEVGLELAGVEYVTSSRFVSDGGDQCLNVVFLGRYDDGTATVREPDELVAVQWVDAEEITEVPDVPSFTREYLASAEQKRNRLGW